MDRLNIQDGGFPLKGDFLTYIEDNAKSINGAMIKALIGEATVCGLYGATFTVENAGGASPTLHVAAGHIYRDGEVYEVQAHTASLSSGTTYADVLNGYYWNPSEIKSTPVTYKSGIVEDAYVSAQAVMLPLQAEWADSAPVSMPTLRDIATALASTTTKGTVVLAEKADLADYEIDPEKAVTVGALGGLGTQFTFTAGNPNTNVTSTVGIIQRLGSMRVVTARFLVTALSDTAELGIYTSITDVFPGITGFRIAAVFHETTWGTEDWKFLMSVETPARLLLHKAGGESFVENERIEVSFSGIFTQ